MIKVIRLLSPAILEQKEQEWTAELCEARRAYYQAMAEFEHGNLDTKPHYPRAQRARYAHRQIKEQLETMTGRKCVYCESSLKESSYPDIEHFRPQSIYPRLAYKWHNLLLACQLCNRGNKSNQFRLIDGTEPVEDKDNPCLRDDTDNSMLINPCIDNPEDFFDFEEEWIVCRENNERAKYTRAVCDLNREDLRDSRKQVLELITLSAEILLELASRTPRNDTQIRNLAVRLQS